MSLFSKFLSTPVRATLLVGGLFASMFANAQMGHMGPMPPAYFPTVTITPAIAAANVERTITVAGRWPNSCAPTGLTPLREAVSATRVLVVRLQFPTPPPSVCAQVFTAYSLTITYTPTTAGEYRVVVVGLGDEHYGEWPMPVQAHGRIQSLYNLSGMWYEARTNGSGLIFTHSFGGTDGVFGAWFLYDLQGRAVWYSIQEGKWTSATEYLATLYETTAATGACPAPATTCPLPFRSLRSIGTVRITLKGRLEAVVDAIAPNGVVLFSSTVVRNI